MLCKTVGLIIAAGKQSRFDSARPKALCEIDGEPIAKRNFNLLKEVCEPYVVVSNRNYNTFSEVFDKDNLIDIGEPGGGSGDAVYKAVNKLINGVTNVIICWGDVILTHDHIVWLKKQTFVNGLLIPARYECDPYVAIDNAGVKFSKYGDVMPDKGYHDLSLFIANKDILLKYMEEFRRYYLPSYQNIKYNHRHGNEFEFLDLLNDTAIPYSIDEVNIIDYSFNTVDEYLSIRDALDSNKIL